GDLVARLLDDENRRAVTLLAGADRAGRGLGEVRADSAVPDRGLHVGDRAGQALGGLLVAPEEVERHALGGPASDAGKTGELGEEAFDGRGIGGSVSGLVGLLAWRGHAGWYSIRPASERPLRATEMERQNPRREIRRGHDMIKVLIGAP